MLFTEFARFRMALKCVKDQKDQRVVQLLLEAVFTPVCTSIINGCDGGSLR